MEPGQNLPAAQIHAEWIRAGGFIVAAVTMSLMAVVDLRDATSWWLVGLSIAAIGAAGQVFDTVVQRLGPPAS